jgi:hypothetical protein
MGILNKSYNYLENKKKLKLSNILEMLKEQSFDTINTTDNLINFNTKIATTMNRTSNYNETLVDYKYICIKKEHFDVSMIYLNYTNLKKRNNIEIIYKSPSIFLDGLFFKTPPINASQLAIFIREKPTFSSIINLTLNTSENITFINMMKSIDTYMSNYIARHAKHINSELNQDIESQKDSVNNQCKNDKFNMGVSISYRYLKYESILKHKINSNANSNANSNNTENTENLGMSKENAKQQIPKQQIPKQQIPNTNKYSSSRNKMNSNNAEYEMTFKSYLDKKILNEVENIIEKNISEIKYVITFNISNIYFNGNILQPLLKCNKIEIQN